MKTVSAVAGSLIALAIVLGTSGSARADDDEVAFNMHNFLDEPVGVWIASEKNTSANPWAHVTVDPGKDGLIRLKSPDRFVIAVDLGKQRSRSKPVAIKAFLAKHPDYVLNLNAEAVVGAQIGQSSSESIPSFYLAPKTPSNDNGNSKANAPVEVPELGFAPEAQEEK